MTDAYAGDNMGASGPANNAAAVVPNDSADLGNATKALFVGGAGTLVVRLVGAPTTNVTFSAVPAGTTIPIRVVRVMSTGTGATSIVALF